MRRAATVTPGVQRRGRAGWHTHRGARGTTGARGRDGGSSSVCGGGRACQCGGTSREGTGDRPAQRSVRVVAAAATRQARCSPRTRHSSCGSHGSHLAGLRGIALVGRPQLERAAVLVAPRFAQVDDQVEAPLEARDRVARVVAVKVELAARRVRMQPAAVAVGIGLERRVGRHAGALALERVVVDVPQRAGVGIRKLRGQPARDRFCEEVVNHNVRHRRGGRERRRELRRRADPRAEERVEVGGVAGQAVGRDVHRALVAPPRPQALALAGAHFARVHVLTLLRVDRLRIRPGGLTRMASCVTS
eukprot:4353714-Prymnesium_polylepis.1